MTEAEVSLRLALWLITSDRVNGDVSVAIDGAQVRTGTETHFQISEFLSQLGWRSETSEQWQGRYCRPNSKSRILVHSKSGVGDVVADLKDGHRLRVECKKGPVIPSSSSAEYPLLRSAIGHVVTFEEVDTRDVIAVAVPNSERFRTLASRWRNAPLLKKCGIRILLIDPETGVTGFDEAS